MSYVDHRGLYAIDPSCNGCPNPVSMNDKRSLGEIIKSETDVWCAARLGQVRDVAVRDCLHESCMKGKVACSHGGPFCNGSAEGYSSCGWGCGVLVRIGAIDPVRTANLCGNNVVFWALPGEAGGTVIHEWTHGCGYDPDNGSIAGVPRSGD
jgi:hypothetical protein